MELWSLVFAVVLGRFIHDFLDGIFVAIVERIRDRRVDRKIGFANDSEGKKTSKGAQMRRIGFGEND